MASSSSSNADPGATITVSQHEFNQFHRIDRSLFARLVVSLGCDPSEATRVMAYLIWLEKMSKDFRLVSKLLTWPDTLLCNLVNEAVLALNCIASDQFAYGVNAIDGLPLTQGVTQRCVTVRYLHENRASIIRAVTKIVYDVCVRAFTDMVQGVQYEKAPRDLNLTNNNVGKTFGQVIYYNYPHGIGVVPQHIGVSASHMNERSSNINAWGGGGGGVSFDIPFHPACEEELIFQNYELNEMFKRLELNLITGERTDDVPPDERTIFLTFSKGYPISEAEVRDYFSRRYGDIIEAVYMQEVQPLEQPLFARLVIRSIAINLIDVVLEGTGRVKFTINGKHVWARKYVRKNTKSPQETSPTTSSDSA